MVTTPSSGSAGAVTEPPGEDRFQVFVLNAAEDQAWTSGVLLDGLRHAGVRYLDESQFRLGMPQVQQFTEAVERSDRVVLVVSPAFLADSRAEFVKLLATHYGAEHSTWPVVPLLLHPVARLPLDLSLLSSLDMTDEALWEQGLARLVDDIDRELPPPGTPPPCPYPGMAPIPRGSTAMYGRDAEIEEVVDAIIRQPVLAVIGTSGSGKSSLLAAGVEPRLESQGHRVVAFRPGADPDAALRLALDGARAEGSTATGADAAPARPTVLVIDQFEEAFTLTGHASGDTGAIDAFCAALVAAWSSGAFRCIIAMRADYYPQLMASPLWGHVRDRRFELLPLAGDQLREAIRAPATAVGVHVEAALVEAVVHDAAGAPGALPLIQETLVLLWGRLHRRYLPISAYDALVLPGRSYGEPPRTGLQVALARHANATMAALGEADQVTARRILLRLVQLMDGREDVRRQQRRRDLESVEGDGEAFDRVLEHLVASRLVTSSADAATTGPDDTAFDLAHEAVISAWPELRGWIAERREAERFRRRLEAEADKWVDLQRTGGLLDDVELAEARAWLDGPDASELGTSRNVTEFVATSQSTLDAARARTTRLNRLFRVLSAALAVLLVAVVVAAVVAVRQRNEAEDRRLVSRSSELALTAEGLPPEQVDRALLLAEAGLSVRSTPTTIGGMLRALSSNARVERVIPAPASQLTVVTPDGSRAVTGGLDGVVRVWDLASGAQGRVLASVRGEVRSLALRPDGSTVLVTSSEGDVGEWELATGRRRAEGGQAGGAAHQGSVRASAFSHDGRLVVTAGQDGLAIVRDASTGRVVHSFGGYRDWLNAAVFTPDDRTLVVAGGRTEGRSVDRRILLWDTGSGRLRATLLGHDDAVRALAVSPDGRLLASGGAEGSVKLWSLPDGRLLRQIKAHVDRIFGVAFSPDGRLLATAGRDHTIRVWDPGTGKAVMEPLLGHGDSVRGLAFAGERRLVSVGNDDRVFLWDVSPVPRARLATPVPDQRTQTRAVAVDPAGTLVATGDDSGRVVVRRATDGAATGVTVDTGAPISDLALGPGSMLVTVTFAGSIRVWDATSGVPRTAAVDLGEGSPRVAVSPDGRLVATGGDRNVVRLWDPGLREVAALTGHRNWIRDLAFRARDGALVSAGADGTAMLWTDLGGSRTRAVLNQRSSLMDAVAISPDGRTIATGNVEGQVILWDASATDARPADRPTLAGHEGGVTGIAYDPTGRWLVTTDGAGTVRLWAAGSGLEPLGSLGRAAALSGVVTVAGEGAFTVGAGGPARWTLDENAWRRTACTVAGRQITGEEAARYGFTAPPRCPGGSAS